jgi:hypothetical protein
MTSHEDLEPTPCNACKRPEVIDGPDPAAHWNSPFGTVIVAWSCSPECSAQLEALRTPAGNLLLQNVI